MAKITPFQSEKGTALYSCARCGRMFKAHKATDYCPDCTSVLYEE